VYDWALRRRAHYGGWGRGLSKRRLVPSVSDIRVMADFIDHTLTTYSRLLDDGRGLRNPEREALQAALSEFWEQGAERIVSQYRALDDEIIRDAGLYGHQFRAKSEIARLAGEDIVGRGPADDDFLDPEQIAGRGRFSRRRRIRRWLKRARVAVGSMKGVIPAAEALMELLDLLDGALDRA
jgi:hypothetical protein